ncbi:hypothetical protein P8V03_06810 [Clostridium sp. A1-XYC3]|uniref:Lipoprotein n=1 Tax=Clostridium tanneri TaxID=3037988 RepID=A0ABU4JRT2_9CLOT|nr:hypothetical protein [Clostridium sp. A1-XYC3]MDW8800863.1 hypothetical protein [Clostridium sp. A1-XYC3]
MKKVASLVAAALVTCSLSACGNRNTAYRNNNVNQPVRNAAQDIRNAGQNVGQNVRNDVTNRNTANAPNVSTAGYKDGVYLGEGNKDSRGTDAAIVTVSGGRITDVVLKTLDPQGRDVAHYNLTPGTTVGTTTGNNANGTVGNNNAAGPTPGVNNRATGNTGSAMGGTGTTGGTMGNNANGVTGGAIGGPTGGVMGGTNTSISGRNADVAPNGNAYKGGHTGTATGPDATATSLTTLDRAKIDLAAAIVRNQTANVNISSSHPATVDNWKLAVSRALESAKR